MTAFEATGRLLGRQIREAAVDHAAFERPLKVCELARCRATCCHDGVVLGEEEVQVIGEVVESKGEQLQGLGWEGGEWLEERDGKWKTRTRAAEPGELAEDFSDHFPKTRCVFLDGEHRCVLQRLSVEEGRPPWYWKPVSCWMQPIRVQAAPGERPVLTLPGVADDPKARGGYPGFSPCTPCGREEAEGGKAGRVLRAELDMLGALGERNLRRELA